MKHEEPPIIEKTPTNESEEGFQKYFDFLDKIDSLDKENFINNFHEIRDFLRHAYGDIYIYNKTNKETEEIIEKIEKLLYKKIEDYSLPHFYKLLLDKYTEIETRKDLLNKENYLYKTIGDMEMSQPLKISDKYGNDLLVLSCNGKIKVANLEYENEIKDWLGYSQMYAHSYEKGIEEVYNKYFIQELNLENLELDKEDLNAFTTFLGDDCQGLIKEFLDKSILNNDDRYLSVLTSNGKEGFYFTKYFSQCDKNTFLKIEKFIKKYSLNGFRTFLSLAHSEEKIKMGDKIINLGEQLSEDEASEIFKGYGDLLDSSKYLEDVLDTSIESVKIETFEGVDLKKLPKEIVTSLIVRAKDILIGAEKVIENNDKLNTKDVTDAVLGINTLISIISNIRECNKYNYERLESKGNKEGEYLSKYIVRDKENYEYSLKVFIRPKAEKDAQARVNIELSFDTENPNERLKKAFYNETINHKENKISKGSVLRIGIDRDDFVSGGAVSLDIGRSERNTEKYSRTGDVLGNLLSMVGDEGHHDTNSFSKEFANEDVFEKITMALARYFEKNT